jgi:hypothetical protein
VWRGDGERGTRKTAYRPSLEKTPYRAVADIAESKTIRPSVPGGSDLARMKEILLALKREGEKAPGAGGF